MAKRKSTKKKTTRKAAKKAPARKKAAKKTTARKKATKKAPARKKAAKKATKKATKRTTKKAATASRPGKIVPASKPRTKSDIFNQIAEQTGLARKEVQSVFDAFGTVLAADLGKRGPGVMQVPGLMKVVVKRLPATRARKGINPFTKEETVFKAKPARNVVKVRPLQGLKKMV